jgi:hypothetical protein
MAWGLHNNYFLKIFKLIYTYLNYIIIIEGEPAEKVVLHYFLVICAQFVLNK